MRLLILTFAPRYLLVTLSIAATALLAGLLGHQPDRLHALVAPLMLFSSLGLIGLRDLTQTRHAILRNYPIIAHLRFLLEEIRPEMRQYFFETDTDGMPFSRDKRAIVYQRAKNELDKRPFGTQHDVYQTQFEWMHHSMAPAPVVREGFRIFDWRAGLRQALSGLGLQHLRHELRLAVGQCGALAQPGRQTRRLCPRHRRRRLLALPRGARRRHHLGVRAQAISAPATRMARSRPSASPRLRRSRRSRWSS